MIRHRALIDLQPAAVHVHESHADRRIAERGLEELAHLPEALLQFQARPLGALARGDLSLELGVERNEVPCCSVLESESIALNQPQAPGTVVTGMSTLYKGDARPVVSRCRNVI